MVQSLAGPRIAGLWADSNRSFHTKIRLHLLRDKVNNLDLKIGTCVFLANDNWRTLMDTDDRSQYLTKNTTAWEWSHLTGYKVNGRAHILEEIWGRGEVAYSRCVEESLVVSRFDRMFPCAFLFRTCSWVTCRIHSLGKSWISPGWSIKLIDSRISSVSDSDVV